MGGRIKGAYFRRRPPDFGCYTDDVFLRDPAETAAVFVGTALACENKYMSVGDDREFFPFGAPKLVVGPFLRKFERFESAVYGGIVDVEFAFQQEDAFTGDAGDDAEQTVFVSFRDFLGSEHDKVATLERK